MPCIYTFNGTQYTETDLSALYKDVRAFLNSPRTVSEENGEVRTSSSVGVVTGIPGVYNVPNSGLTVEQSNQFIDLLQPQIKNQAYVENKAKTANYMFSFGLRWARSIPNKGEKSEQGKILGRPRPNKKSIKSKESGTYGYFTTDQNNNPLPPITDLKPIMDFIESKLNIDLSNYDAMLGNIYDNYSFISQHRDTTESITAENYPVVVINLGSNGHLEYDKDTTSTYAEYKKTGQLDLSNGGIYAFGVDGVNRFTFHHRIGQGLESANPLKPITLPDGTVLKNYRITLTFRRASDLEPGMPDNPNKKKEQFKESAVSTPVETENNPADYTNHSGGAPGVDIDGDIIGREFGVENHVHYYTGTKSNLNSPYGNKEVTANDITEGAKKVAQAANKMWGNNVDGKIVPYSYATMKDSRLIRNWSQVKYSEGIYAVAPLGLKGDAWREDVKSGKSNPRILLKDGVQGGTGYAVEMGIQNGNKVYVFNTVTNSKYDTGWYQVVNGEYIKLSEPPVLTKNFAIIGSRDNSEIGKQAIRDVYANTFQTAVPTSPSGTIDFNSITEFTPEKRKEILNTFSEKYKMTEDQALNFINEALQQDREGTITLLKECY